MIKLRKTSNKIQRRVFELWLEGHAYRKIGDKLSVSLGTISGIIERIRKKTPDLNDLRKLNLKIRKQGSNVYDLFRGTQLLEKVNNFGINLERLESFLKVMSEIVSERQIGEEKLVNASLTLLRLEDQSHKPYKEFVQDFEAKHEDIKHLQFKTKKTLKEIKKLNLEKMSEK